MRYRWGAVALLLIFGWLQFSTLSLTSPTVDEPLHIFRGYAFVARGEDRYRMYGPRLSDALSGISLLLEPPLQLPSPDNPVWEKTANTDDPDGFIWGNDVPSSQIFFLARLPIIAASFLLGALIFHWATERSGSQAALGALTLYIIFSQYFGARTPGHNRYHYRSDFLRQRIRFSARIDLCPIEGTTIKRNCFGSCPSF